MYQDLKYQIHNFQNNNRSNSHGNRSKSQTNSKYSQALAIVGRNAITNNNSLNKLVSKNPSNYQQQQQQQQISSFQQQQQQQQQQQFSAQKQINLNNKIYNQQNEKHSDNNPYFHKQKSINPYNQLDDLKTSWAKEDISVALKLTPSNSSSRRQNTRNFRQNPQSAHPSSHWNKNQNNSNFNNYNYINQKQNQRKNYYQNEKFYNSGNQYQSQNQQNQQQTQQKQQQMHNQNQNYQQLYEPEYQDFCDRQIQRNRSQDTRTTTAQKYSYSNNNNNNNQNSNFSNQHFYSKHPPQRSAKSREAKNHNKNYPQSNNIIPFQNSQIFEQNCAANYLNNPRESLNLNNNNKNNLHQNNRSNKYINQQPQTAKQKPQTLNQNKNKRPSKIPRPPNTNQNSNLNTENDEINSFIQENLKYNEMRQHTEMPEIKENENMLLSNEQSKLLKEYSFLNNTSTVLIFDGGSQLDNDFFKDQKEDLDIKQINDHLRTCAEIDKSIIQTQVLEGDLQDIRLSYDYFDLIKNLIINCHKIGHPKQNNDSMVFYLKYFTFCLQGVEELLFREDIEDDFIFESFLNSFSFKITSQLQQQVINEFAKRNGKRFFYLSEIKRLNFWNFLKNYLKKIKLQICQTNSFLNFFDAFEQILKNNQIRSDLYQDEEIQNLIQQNIQKQNISAIFLNLIQQRFFKKIEIEKHIQKQNQENQENQEQNQVDKQEKFIEVCYQVLEKDKIANNNIKNEFKINLKKLEKILNLIPNKNTLTTENS